jgi:protein-L-isoaspartate(D-aspartate) O-methyltransferase
MSNSPEQHQLIRQLRERGIIDERVLAAMEAVPRDRFVPNEHRSAAFEDHALPIAAGQTISQPYMVGLMTQELGLGGSETVLEIGTGSGYQAAILSRLCRHVVSVERIPELSNAARQLLESLGCNNVECHVGDGSLGHPEGAPYDRVLVTAAAPEIPPSLYEQLAIGGRLVIPIGAGRPQILQVVTKGPAGPVAVDACECSFVPLIGLAGWHEQPPNRLTAT